MHRILNDFTGTNIETRIILGRAALLHTYSVGITKSRSDDQTKLDPTHAG